MGVIKQGILGGFSGSVANVVGSSWKGIAVIKSKPLSVANPRTVAQVGNRVKFKAGSELASKLLVRIVKPLWDRDAQRMSGFNAWVQENHDYFNSLGEPQRGTLTISKGNLEPAPITDLSINDTTGVVLVEWDGSALEGQQLATDIAYCVVVRTVEAEVEVIAYDIARSVGQAEVDFGGALLPSERIDAYLAFRSADGFRLFDQAHHTDSV